MMKDHSERISAAVNKLGQTLQLSYVTHSNVKKIKVLFRFDIKKISVCTFIVFLLNSARNLLR
jgi:hypothetical protein